MKQLIDRYVFDVTGLVFTPAGFEKRVPLGESIDNFGLSCFIGSVLGKLSNSSS